MQENSQELIIHGKEKEKNISNAFANKSGYKILDTIVKYVDFVIILLSLAVIIFSEKKYVGLLGLLYVAILFLANYISKKYESVAIFIITIWLQIVGPIEMILMQFAEESIVGRSYLEYIDLMQNELSYFLYFIYSSLMYIVLFTTLITCKKIKGNWNMLLSFRVKRKAGVKIYRIFLNILFLSVASVLIFYFRRRYNLDVPGKNPNIEFAGLFVYSFQAAELLLLYKVFDAVFDKVERIRIRDCIIALLGCVIYGIPSILLDQRAPFFVSILLLGLYIYSTKQESIYVFVKKYKYILLLFIVAIFGAFQLITNNVRYGGNYHVSILYIFSRLVGIAPGLIFYDYVIKAGNGIYNTFGLLDYIDNAVGSRSSSINKIFTHEVLGFSSDAIHASSVPPFIGAQLYHGIIGLIVISIIFGVFLSMGEGLLNSRRSDFFKFLGAFFLIKTIMTFMGGGIESLIELLSVPIITLLLFFIV